MQTACRLAEQYRRVDVSGRLTDAGPHKRVSLLLEAACSYIRRAQVCLDNGNNSLAKGQAISQACTVIAHLSGALDFAAGGEIARNLADLYDYLLCRLTWANAQNDLEALEESLSLLSQIESAWNALPAQLN